MDPNMTLRHRGVCSKAARLTAFVLLLVSASLLAACSEMTLPQASPAAVETLREQSTPDLAAEAEGFFKAGNAELSELLYSRLLERGDLSREDRLTALDRLAESAFRAKHYRQAKLALDRRAGADKNVLGAWPWHELYFKTLTALGRADLLDTHEAWILAHTELPYGVRSRAVLAFAEYAIHTGDNARALSLLSDIHRQAPDTESKLLLESRFAASLRELPQEQIAALLRLVGKGGANLFPNALVQREGMRRVPALHSASATGNIRGTLLAQSARALSDQPAALLPAQDGATVRLALVLPLTGRFAATGQKVLRGAGAAQKHLGTQGRKVEINVINAEAPDWRAQLAALPANVTVVGGPLLNAEAMRNMQADGTLAKRAVFAFLPDLGPIVEGRQAWRFYPSLQDQARALITLTSERLGIRSVAVLSPKNRYGQRMAEVFLTEAKARGLRIAATETYPPDDHPRWIHSVSHLLKIPDGFRRNKNMPLPLPDFGAVFMPEDWAQAEMLTSNFYFFEGQHLLFLGTDLWSVGLDNAKDIDDNYFQHAACPGAWWPETNAARALQSVLDEQSQGQADFWVALGYDFVRLGERLKLGADWTAAEVDMRLAGLKGLDYSMAPLTWNAEGQARQSLFVFTPRKEGKALVDADSMRESIEKAKSRREKRLSSSREIHKSKKSGDSGSLTRDAKD